MSGRVVAIGRLLAQESPVELEHQFFRLINWCHFLVFDVMG
jgi:hypothetical protein